MTDAHDADRYIEGVLSENERMRTLLMKMDAYLGEAERIYFVATGETDGGEVSSLRREIREVVG